MLNLRFEPMNLQLQGLEAIGCSYQNYENQSVVKHQPCTQSGIRGPSFLTQDDAFKSNITIVLDSYCNLVDSLRL